jgi:hypothetical protein
VSGRRCGERAKATGGDAATRGVLDTCCTAHVGVRRERRIGTCICHRVGRILLGSGVMSWYSCDEIPALPSDPVTAWLDSRETSRLC